MAFIKASVGRDFMKRLAEALGLNPGAVRRLVIECDAKSLVTVYVVGHVDESQAGRVVELAEGVRLCPVAGVVVGEKGDVAAAPPGG